MYLSSYPSFLPHESSPISMVSPTDAPLVEVSLGRNLDPGRIKEGDDVYFECSVKAKPAISRVAWRHNVSS